MVLIINAFKIILLNLNRWVYCIHYRIINRKDLFLFKCIVLYISLWYFPCLARLFSISMLESPLFIFKADLYIAVYVRPFIDSIKELFFFSYSHCSVFLPLSKLLSLILNLSISGLFFPQSINILIAFTAVQGKRRERREKRQIKEREEEYHTLFN